MQDRTDITRMMRIMALLWLIYLTISAIIDYALKSPGRVQEYFYLTSGAITVVIVGLSFWSWLQNLLGRAFLPTVIFLICVLPAAIDQIAVHYFFNNMQAPPEALLSRVVPFILSALILTAWHYRMWYVIIFCVLEAGLNTGILFVFAGSNRADLLNGLFAILTQVLVFFVVGLFINLLVERLHRERAALKEANLKLVNYSKTLEDLAISRERTRLAQELHDTLSHTLSGLTVQLETMKAYWDVDMSVVKGVLEKSVQATRGGLEETRRALLALRAKPLEELGLAVAVRQLAQETASRADLALALSIDEDLPPVTPAIEQCLYRVAQEALNNVYKHAKARNLTVKLSSENGHTAIIVGDDGIGFDTKTNGQGHFGLSGMHERVQCTGGTLMINSQPGQGTTVQLTI